MSELLEQIGLTQEEIQERVVSRICEQLLSSIEYDPDDGSEYPIASKFKNAIEKRITEKVNETINALAEKHILPNVAQYIEEVTLQKTNSWGEKQGSPVTFIEYLTNQAHEYMLEKVSYEGKSKSEANGFSWNGTQTRLTHLVEKHLHYSIERAMKDALSVANSAIANGIQETVKLKLSEISNGLSLSVKTK